MPLNPGDTAWIIVATAFVILMTLPGLALFYGGLTPNKNLVNTFMMAFTTFCLVGILWFMVGYSLAFGPDIGGLIGGLSKVIYIPKDSLVGSIPETVFASFQMTFAVITVVLISGAVIERMKFSSWVIFAVLWALFIYSPLAHWVWGGGWLGKHGELDFAGGTVVHISAGISALILASLLGHRKRKELPSSPILTAIGAGLLLVGWIGFNVGSALAANFLAGVALVTTLFAAAAGGISWLFLEWYKTKKPTLVGVSSGIVAGLVGITPACGYVDMLAAFIIGLVSGILGFLGVTKIKTMIGKDDALDVFGIHGICGIWGSIATGLFANPKIQEGCAGLFYGNPKQVIIQLEGILITLIFCAIGTFVIAKVVSVLTKGLRVDPQIEEYGLDSEFHGEKSFNLY